MSNLNDIIAEIKGNVNVLDLIERYNLEPKKTGRQYQCLCPFHQEKTPSFTVNINKSYYKCFGCDWSGDVIEFVKEFNKLDTVAACKELIAIYGLNITFDDNLMPQQPKKQPQRKPQKQLLPVTLPHLEFASFPDDYKVISPPTNRVKTKKHPNPEVTHIATTSYIYSSEPLTWKQKTELFNHDHRIDKTFDWMRLDSFGDTKKGKGDFTGNCYKLEEAINFGEGKIIAITEGEKDVETLRQLGIVAISFDSSNYDDLKSIKCDGFVIFGDYDVAGTNKAGKIADYCTKNKIPFLFAPVHYLWSDADKTNDITDYYENFCKENPESNFVTQLKDDLRAVLEENENDRITALEYTEFKVGDIVQIKSDSPPVWDYLKGKKLEITGITPKEYTFLVYGEKSPYHAISKDKLELWVDRDTENQEIENSENIAQNQDQNIRGIIFNKIAREGLGKGKTATRREWTAKTAQKYIDYYHQGTLIPALSGRLDRSGVELGKIRLTSEPYQQPLSEMTKEDLTKEGFPTWTLERFYYEFFDGDNAKNVWVFDFEFYPNQQKQKFDDLQDQYRELTSEQREEIYTEIALNELYSDSNFPYRSIDGEMYQWNGTHYEKCKEALEKNRISRWLVNFSPKLALKEKVNQVWEWAIYNLPVDLDSVNPSGLNVLNGVLKVNFDSNGKGTVTLENHDYNQIYTYCAPIKYDPDIDPSHYHKLMECLDPPQRKIFIRTMAMAFDLPYFKAKNGRPRALLLNGTGSNGKDALGKSIKAIFGHSMANASLGDFRDYDSNRKFPLAKLDGSMVSWSSENVGNANIEDIQSLKAAISGETLSYELKGGNERPFEPRCVFVFNCNKPPSFKSDIEAIKTRWAILNFTKTFKTHPNKRNGECQADPRFNDDLDFIHTHLAPAMLNDMIAQLEDLAINGIDYSPVTENLEAIQKQSSHLFQFCEDCGIIQNSDGMIWVSDLWDLLRQWYIDNGVLEVIPMEKGKTKEIWNDQPVKGDQNVKASNQVVKRFVSLFPKVKRCVEAKDRDNLNRVYLKGIEKIALTDLQPHESSNIGLTDTLTSEDAVKATTLTQIECKSVKANSSIPSGELSNLSKVKEMSFLEKTSYLDQILTQEDWEMLEMSFFLTKMLFDCSLKHDLVTLTELRGGYDKGLLKLANRRLPKDRKKAIAQMIQELDQTKSEFKIGDKILINGYPDHPNNHFQVLGIMDGMVKVDLPVGGAKYFPVSEVKKVN